MSTLEPPRLSVVVATRDRPDDVEQLLASLAASDPGHVVSEVILVDDASQQPLCPSHGQLPVSVVRNDVRLGAALSRNRGAALATGTMLAFLDDDCRVTPTWCEVAESHVRGGTRAVTGRIMPFDTGTVSRARQYRYERRYEAQQAGTSVTFFAGGNSLIDRRVFLAAGGFPDQASASDNALVARLHAQGEQVCFDPALRVLHRNGKGIRTAVREAWRSGRTATDRGGGTLLASLAGAVVAQPWREDPAAAALNTALQAVHSTGRAVPNQARRGPFRAAGPEPTTSSDEPALEISELVVASGPRGAENVLITAVSARVAPATILAAVGDRPSRDALADVLTGRRTATYGSVRLTCEPAQTRPGRRLRTRAPAGIALVSAGAAVPPSCRAAVVDAAGWAGALDAINLLRQRRVPLVVLVDPADPSAPAVLAQAEEVRYLQGGTRAGSLSTEPRPARGIGTEPRPARGIGAEPRPARDGCTVRIPMEALTRQAEGSLRGAGVPDAVACLVAGTLVDANRRGHHSHGVQMLPVYLERVRRGGIDPAAVPEWSSAHGAVRLLDAHGGFGQVAADLAARTAAVDARRFGLAAVGVRGNNHIGMLAAYRRSFADGQVVGLILNISGPSVSAPGAATATLGNNAVCLIVPQPGRPPFVIDFATGAVACGKIRDAALRNLSIPEGWLLDAGGRPTSNAADLDAGGSVPVFGGHKGLAVALIVEVLAGMLGAGTISPNVSRQRAEPAKPMGCGQLFLGLDPVAFGDPPLASLVDELAAAVRAGYPDAPAHPYLPEQVELACSERADREGVDIPRALCDQLGWEVG